MSKIDTPDPIIKFDTCFYVEYKGKCYGSFTTLAGAKAWLEAQADESL